MNRSFSVRQILFHPSMLAVLSGLVGAVIGFLINLVSGGNSSQLIWTALTFAIVFNLTITAWQVFTQEKTQQQLTTMLQEMVFHSYYLTVLADKPEISRMAQQRLSHVFHAFNAEQQVIMLKFFSEHGLPTTFVGNALKGSSALAGADLHQIELPQINLEQANLSRVNLSEANLSEAHLQEALLLHANLSGANLCQARLNKTLLLAANLTRANLTGADLSEAIFGVEKRDSASSDLQAGKRLRSDPPANLTNALLSHAHLQGAMLYGVDLKGANLQGADLTSAILKGVDLSGANLQGANLTSATLSEVNLQGADLTLATLLGATLDEADLRTAKVTQEQLNTASSSTNIKRTLTL
jgi:uncharacterized protein YjbI with pentapeptide repeats